MIDFKGIAADLLSRASDVLAQWFPDGKLRGREFVVGSLNGEPGESLSINVDTGVWKDFAGGEGGADLISLYAKMHGIGNGEAARRLQGPATSAKSTAKRGAKPKATAPPPGTPAPAMAHWQHGKPTMTWCYRDAKGEPINYVARYNTPGGKEVVPWSWVDGAWKMQAAAKPRPLYGLDRLAANPEAAVILVEGEKPADACQAMAPDRVAVTWAGGAQADAYADWTPLYGRKVLLWPDADNSITREGKTLPYEEQPGPAAMKRIAERLAPHCPMVRLLDVRDRPDGWDAADAVAEGWDWGTFQTWARERMTTVEAAPGATPGSAPAPGVTSRTALWARLDLERTGSGMPLANLDNVVRVLERHESLVGRIWFDLFLERMLTTWDATEQEWSDADDCRLQLWLQREVGLSKVSLQTVHDAVRYVARKHPRNQLSEWVSALRWDGLTNVEDVLIRGFGAPNTNYHRQVGRCWMVSLVARALRPGCKVDTMIVLEGAQGVGKSSGLRVLGEPWFTECHEEISGKDFYGVISGRWLVEIAEMHAFSRSEIDKVKGIISNQNDRYRAPYARHAEDHPRRCVFAGTTNRTDWNEDPTGARRFWPVKTGQVDLAWLKEKRDQLYAHAATLLRSGGNWWDVDREEAERQQEMRRRADAWEPLISAYLKKMLDGGEEWVTTGQVLTGAVGLQSHQQTMAEQKRAVASIKLSGWVQGSRRVGENKTRIWLPPMPVGSEQAEQSAVDEAEPAAGGEQ
jgi:putative DNA primase/helicase